MADTFQTCTRCGKRFQKQDQSVGNVCPDCKTGNSGKRKFSKWYFAFVVAVLVIGLIQYCQGH
jgi:predicted RNA-binding Zn-ribbon protein involved in translation (DUF1610 family)